MSRESSSSNSEDRPVWSLREPDVSVDVRGESCPIPEMTASKRLKELAPGKVLEILTDNQTSVDLTLPDLARQSGCGFHSEKDGNTYHVFIAKP